MEVLPGRVDDMVERRRAVAAGVAIAEHLMHHGHHPEGDQRCRRPDLQVPEVGHRRRINILEIAIREPN